MKNGYLIAVMVKMTKRNGQLVRRRRRRRRKMTSMLERVKSRLMKARCQLQLRILPLLPRLLLLGAVPKVAMGLLAVLLSVPYIIPSLSSLLPPFLLLQHQ
jgi:hypothetical protein